MIQQGVMMMNNTAKSNVCKLKANISSSGNLQSHHVCISILKPKHVNSIRLFRLAHHSPGFACLFVSIPVAFATYGAHWKLLTQMRPPFAPC